MIERKYMIISTSEIDKIDFSQILQTSEETLRKSIDGTKAIIKWDDSEPTFISLLEYKDGPYTYEDILSIISTSEWQHQPEEY